MYGFLRGTKGEKVDEDGEVLPTKLGKVCRIDM